MPDKSSNTAGGRAAGSGAGAAWTASTGPSSSSASALRPSGRRGPSGAWSRLKPVVSDPLDAYGLPSKGETRLHDYKTQESYYGKIVERYMKFCAASGAGEGLEAAFASLSLSKNNSHIDAAASSSKEGQTEAGISNSSRPLLQHRASATERPNDMPNILHAMRKLREGILGSRRRDAFAQRAYMFIIHASILTRHWESYQPALRYLLHDIHTCTPMSIPELHEFVGYQVLDLACRQYELVEAFSVRFQFELRDRKVSVVLKALVNDDWVRFWRSQRAVDGYQRAIMQFAVERMRTHALKCLGRGYMNADRAFVERTADQSWDELVKGGVGWRLEENGNIIVRKPKAN